MNAFTRCRPPQRVVSRPVGPNSDALHEMLPPVAGTVVRFLPLARDRHLVKQELAEVQTTEDLGYA